MAKPIIPIVSSDSTIRVTPEDAIEVGLRLGTVFNKICVAIDANPYSVPISKAFISGALAAGADVTSTGICPAPAAHLALKDKCQCTVCIGCPDVSGIVSISFYSQDGSPFATVDKRFLDTEVVDLPPYTNLGTYTDSTDANTKYIDFIHGSGFTSSSSIVVDCGCGSVSKVAPDSLSKIGADVFSFDADIRKRKLRTPKPTEANMRRIPIIPEKQKGFIGISYNGDGTSLMAMDEKGNAISPDKLLALLLIYLEPRTAVIPFDAPQLIEDAFNQPLGIRPGGHGTDPERAIIRAVGEDSIIEECRSKFADFAYLGDGRFLFPEVSLCPDAIYASAVLAEISGIRSIANILDKLPEYEEEEIKIPFSGIPRVFGNKLSETSILRYHVKDFARCGNAWKTFMPHGQYTITIRGDSLYLKAESSDHLYLKTMMEQARQIISECMRS